MHISENEKGSRNTDRASCVALFLRVFRPRFPNLAATDQEYSSTADQLDPKSPVAVLRLQRSRVGNVSKAFPAKRIGNTCDQICIVPVLNLPGQWCPQFVPKLGSSAYVDERSSVTHFPLGTTSRNLARPITPNRPPNRGEQAVPPRRRSRRATENAPVMIERFPYKSRPR